MTLLELANCVECPRCHARRGESCATALRRAALAAHDNVAMREIAELELATGGRLAHPERMKRAQALVQAAEAYGMVRRVPAKDDRS